MKRLWDKKELVDLIDETVVIPEGSVMEYLDCWQLYPDDQVIINFTVYGTYDILIFIVYDKNDQFYVGSNIFDMYHGAIGYFKLNDDIVFYYDYNEGNVLIDTVSDINDLELYVWGLKA